MGLLAIPAPFDFELSTRRFRAFGRDLANLWEDGRLYRVVGGREVAIEAAPGGARVEPLDAETGAVVRRFLGSDFDLDAFAAFAAQDAVLAPIVARLRGLRPPVAPDPFEALVTSITAQQVSLYSAFAVRSRLVERFGVRASRVYAFPTRERIALASEEEVTAVGFSRRKAEYVLALARSELDLDSLAGLPDDDDVKRALTAQRGLGEWSADWFLARHLGRPRAWPAGDLGLRKAVSAFYGDGRELTTEEVRAIGDRFDPFQNLTAHYLLTAHQLGGP